MTRPSDLERDFFRALDGYIIATVEDTLGNDDPGISRDSARAELQMQIRILCNEACNKGPDTDLRAGLAVPLDNFEMKDLFYHS